MSNGAMSLETRKREIGEMLWLHYYNQVLFEKGMISMDEHNRMSNSINARSNVR